MVSIGKETFGDELPIGRSGIRVLVINFQRRGPIRTPRVKRIQNDVLSRFEVVRDELAGRVVTNNSFRWMAFCDLSQELLDDLGLAGARIA